MVAEPFRSTYWYLVLCILYRVPLLSRMQCLFAHQKEMTDPFQAIS